MKRHKRKVVMTYTPRVQANTYGRYIMIETGGSTPSTVFHCVGKLEVYCAVQLVRNLRKALREIRDQETARLVEAVNSAEGRL